MANAKKFGAFAGVFTPSILTILGVIMYMRLGWVVGQAGLISAIIIILLAHVISLSTGLSVSSIATDKKIKAGGIYYILSRSLGLPMGGSIGITLFIGTALSISLYLVGFAENFLSIEPIREFLGLEQNLAGYRIIGTSAIFILFAIAFISTSLAIKTQFYILGAIGLSLVSILVGFFLNSGFHPEQIVLDPVSSDVDFALIFAVFFPAVTGFTAGVALSGDLKDPKKSIPIGTMASITIGLVIYIGLAIAIAFFVNRDLLLTDINFLMKVAWFAPLVVAGIWGATLSSALGGILGGPRILQAMSADRIGPAFFSKVYGVNKEPRIALVVIFLIAEAGILIGELNVIARVVSMFYLASYGFINIAYYLESWASTDFRPSFRINRYIGLIGFIAAFGVMFQLDVLSMFAALVIMISIYFFLKRKQLKLEYGDVWQSVWSSLMRTALAKMDKAEEVERNWQPNIILFSGGTKKRPYLLSLGRNFVGKHGVLSNFDLIENKHAKVLFPKKNQSLPGEESTRGVFTRRQTVKDIYDGIDMISRTYGFSGLEPNTVMLGWARQTQDPVRFVALLKTLYDLDLNVIMLGYDKRVGFGKKDKIDIWFRDKSNHGNLALTLSKLLVMSDDWSNARIRILIVNYLNDKSDSIYKKMDNILDNMRIDAEIKVINNQIEHKPFYEIVKTESELTDLVFLETPSITEIEEKYFVRNTNALLEKIGTVVLLEASSSFKRLKIGLEEYKSPEYSGELALAMKKINLPKIVLPKKTELAEECNSIHEQLTGLTNNYYNKNYRPLMEYRSEKIKAVQQSVEKTYSVLESKLADIKGQEVVQLVSHLKSGLLVKLGKIIEDQVKALPAEVKEVLDDGTIYLVNKLNHIIKQIPDNVKIKLFSNDVAPENKDSFLVVLFKKNTVLFRKQKLQSQGVAYNVKFKNLSSKYLPIKKLESAKNTFAEFGKYNINYVSEFQKLLYTISDALLYIEKNSEKNNLLEILISSKQNIFGHLNQLTELIKSFNNTIQANLLSDDNLIINEIGASVSKVPANIQTSAYPKKKVREITRNLQSLPGKWEENQKILLKSIHTESHLLLVEYRLYKIITQALNEINRILADQVFDRLKQIKESIEPGKKSSPASENQPQNISLGMNSNDLHLNLNKIIDKAFRNIKSILKQLPGDLEVFTEDSINELANKQFTEEKTVKIPVLRLVDYFIQNELIAPLVDSTNQLADNINKLVTKIEDAARLVSLSGKKESNIIGSESFENFDDIESFAEEQQEKVDSNIQTIKIEFETYQKNILNQLNITSNELHLFRLSKATESNLNLSRKETEKRVRFFRSKMNNIKGFVQNQKANLWHSQSEARLLAKKITNEPTGQVNVIDQMLNFKDMVSPKPGNLKKIPFYYQQLFLSQYNFQSEFWFGRQKELTLARKAINRYKAGHKGALIITGGWKSGKSFFANYIISENLKEHPVFTLSPQGRGSCNPEFFLDQLKEATKMGGSVHEIMDKLPDNAVLLLDDMELYWEKSENGMALIELIFNLIRKYSEKIFFILVLNKDVFKIINQINPFEHFALQILQLQSFSSKEIQDIILFRQRTSGLKLQVGNISPDRLSQSQQAKLFNHVFKFSEGNIGAALLCWITSIKDVKNDTIVLQSPRKPDTNVFSLLSQELKIYLIQFILHKRLTIKKLCGILYEEELKVSYTVRYLCRTGIISELAGGIYEIEKFMHIHVEKYLLEEFDKGKYTN
ncbi:MAG: hypothetical protein K8S16_21730 [Bacteroidales bacterium]|nr:hypothetical protein [Bacteroidales bacterium]